MIAKMWLIKGIMEPNLVDYVVTLPVIILTCGLNSLIIPPRPRGNMVQIKENARALISRVLL